MKRILNMIPAIMMMMAVAVPPAVAQGRGTHERRDRVENRNNNRSESRGHSTDNGQRRGSNQNRKDNNIQNNNHNNHHNNQGVTRPGNNSYRPGNNNQGVTRPGNNNNLPGNNNQGYRPDQNNRPGQGVNRPGNSGQRPGANNRPANRPATSDNRHFGGNRPAPRPPMNNFGPNHRPTHMPPPPPSRPYRPVYGHTHYHRPVPPPPTFRPRYHFNPLQAIVGFTFGTALNVSLNLLNNSGYTVDGYANDCIYLSNMSALDMLWPDATLYYNNGYLTSSSFSYSTPYYDLSRYNAAYARLANMYGAPVSVSNGGGVSATWWGYDNRYITLSVQAMQSLGGGLRYYTTLVMGN